jgi:hypothetical protein
MGFMGPEHLSVQAQNQTDQEDLSFPLPFMQTSGKEAGGSTDEDDSEHR